MFFHLLKRLNKFINHPIYINASTHPYLSISYFFCLTRKPREWLRGGARFKTIGIVLSIFLFFNCGTFKPVSQKQLDSLNIPERFEIKGVPFFAQEAFQCGPAVLAMALVWSGVRVMPDTVAPEVFTPSLKGSLQSAVIGAARRHGRVAYPISEMESMLKEVASGHPVIVLQNLALSWFPKWHYSLAVGYDRADNLIILHTGKTERKLLPFGVFERTWRRSKYWGLVVLPPDVLPATAEEGRYVSSITGLERAQRWNDALKAYINALNKWPENYVAHIGMGNCYYYMGDLNAAEDVFRGIIFRFPNKGAAFNNLAQVLLEQGKYNEAFDTIQAAIRIDGPAVEPYQETLEEIQMKRNR